MKLFNGKDHAFFFVNYEEFRLPEQHLRRRRLLTADATNGTFPDGTRSVNLLQLAGANSLPSAFDPAVQKLLADIQATMPKGMLFPVPSAPDFRTSASA